MSAVQGYTFTAQLYSTRGHRELLDTVLTMLAEAGIVAEAARVGVKRPSGRATSCVIRSTR